MIELKVWLVYDANGDVAVHADSANDAWEAYEDNIGGSTPRRCVCVKLQAPDLVGTTLFGTVPAEAPEGSLRAE